MAKHLVLRVLGPGLLEDTLFSEFPVRETSCLHQKFIDSECLVRSTGLPVLLFVLLEGSNWEQNSLGRTSVISTDYLIDNLSSQVI